MGDYFRRCLKNESIGRPETGGAEAAEAGERRPGAQGQGHARPEEVFELISHKIFLKSFCRSQLPHKSVNSSFTIVNIENRLTDSCENCLLREDQGYTAKSMRARKKFSSLSHTLYPLNGFEKSTLPRNRQRIVHYC